jgi:molybdopterin synthase sulfur carrier subunit
MIRIVLPYHLRNLAHAGSEVTVEVEGPITQRSVLDALEARYPMLRSTIRDHATLQRRPFLRFFACEQDLPKNRPTNRNPSRSHSEKSHLSSLLRLQEAEIQIHEGESLENALRRSLEGG